MSPMSAVKDMTSDQKGRIGEDTVCLGFRKMGYDIFRTGIEHTELVTLSRDANIYRNPLFQQKRKSPDFLFKKGDFSYFVEVKLRASITDPLNPNFIKGLITYYLGKPITEGSDSNPLQRTQRLGQKYFSLYRDVCMVLLMPDKAHLARLGDLLWAGQDQSGLSDTWQNAWKMFNSNTWEHIEREYGDNPSEEGKAAMRQRIAYFNCLGEDWQKFSTYYDAVKRSFSLSDYDRGGPPKS